MLIRFLNSIHTSGRRKFSQLLRAIPVIYVPRTRSIAAERPSRLCLRAPLGRPQLDPKQYLTLIGSYSCKNYLTDLKSIRYYNYDPIKDVKDLT